MLLQAHDGVNSLTVRQGFRQMANEGAALAHRSEIEESEELRSSPKGLADKLRSLYWASCRHSSSIFQRQWNKRPENRARNCH